METCFKRFQTGFEIKVYKSILVSAKTILVCTWGLLSIIWAATAMADRSEHRASTRNAAQLGVAKRRKMEANENDAIEDEISSPRDFLDQLRTPLFFSSNAFVLNEPEHTNKCARYRLSSLDIDFVLEPTLGVVFQDLHGKTRHGIIRKSSEHSVSVYILYTKEMLQEVGQNVRFNAQTSRMIGSLEKFECFQSLYTDEFPLKDIIGVFRVNFQQVSMRGSAASVSLGSSSLPQCLLCVGYIYFDINSRNGREECHLSFFGKLNVTFDMLKIFFLNVRSQVDPFQLARDIHKLRTELERWFKTRGEPFLKPHIKRVEVDVEHDEVTSLLLILKAALPAIPDSDYSGLTCSGLKKGECCWTVCESILKHPFIQEQFPVPFKENPYQLEPGSGSLYLEGPVQICLKRNSRFKTVRLCIKFSRLVRLCMFGSESWKIP